MGCTSGFSKDAQCKKTISFLGNPWSFVYMLPTIATKRQGHEARPKQNIQTAIKAGGWRNASNNKRSL
jgi:hypothetical protein